MKSFLRQAAFTAAFASLLAAFAACSSLQDNNGSTLTTAEGEQITEVMLLGKWDLDGERTNTANGNPGVGAIPSDIAKDLFGEGWEFRPSGVLRTDDVVGSIPGTWRIEGKDKLIVKENANSPELHFMASFRDGFLYLKNVGGRFMVFEKDKYFSF